MFSGGCADASLDLMQTLLRSAVAVVLLLTFASCRLKEEAPPLDGPPPIPAPADVAAPPADALRTPSGLASKVLRVGLGEIKPTAASTVVVHYTGWTTDGKMFDSTIARNEPAEFGVSRVIPGWTEGLQLMRIGEKRRFWIPGSLAYDAVQGPPGAPKGMLVFDVELIHIR